MSDANNQLDPPSVRLKIPNVVDILLRRADDLMESEIGNEREAEALRLLPLLWSEADLEALMEHVIPQIKEAMRQLDRELESWGLPAVSSDPCKLYELASLTGRNADHMTYEEVVHWAIELKQEATIRRHQVETDSSTNLLRSIPTAPNTKLLEVHENKESVSGETPSDKLGIAEATTAKVDDDLEWSKWSDWMDKSDIVDELKLGVWKTLVRNNGNGVIQVKNSQDNPRKGRFRKKQVDKLAIETGTSGISGHAGKSP